MPSGLGDHQHSRHEQQNQDDRRRLLHAGGVGRYGRGQHRAAHGTASGPAAGVPAAATTCCRRRSAGQRTHSASSATATKRTKPMSTQASVTRIGALAHAEQRETEHGDPVDRPARPVDAGTEVATEGLGQRSRGAGEATKSAGGRSGGSDGHDPDHDAGHVEQQHDVECRAARLVVHARPVLLCGCRARLAPGDGPATVMPGGASKPVP